MKPTNRIIFNKETGQLCFPRPYPFISEDNILRPMNNSFVSTTLYSYETKKEFDIKYCENEDILRFYSEEIKIGDTRIFYVCYYREVKLLFAGERTPKMFNLIEKELFYFKNINP